jgi:hypothetical protein
MSLTKSLYGVHPAVQISQKWVAALPQKTGRSLDEWLAFIKRSGPAAEKERIAWLKSEFQLGANAAAWLAGHAEGKGTEMDSPEAYLQAAEKYVANMYSGKKEALRPLYDELVRLGLALGSDVKACPCETIVPLYRKHVFAQIKPATLTRIDLGFALGARKPEGRLIDTGGYAKKDRITHRIPISSPAEIDQEVQRWLRVAYEEDQ